MDPISNTDRFAALLRQKLAERARTRGTGRAAGGKVGKAEAGRAPRSVAGLSARAGADDRLLGRTIVEQLLAERLGDGLANEPRFQQVIERVTTLIAEDAELGAMLQDIIAQVRSQS